MNEETTKEYIEKELLNKSGNLNPNKTRKLNISNEELYLIYHELEKPYCKGCKLPLRFYSFKKGYTTCGNRSCPIEKEKTISKKAKNTKNKPKKEVQCSVCGKKVLTKRHNLKTCNSCVKKLNKEQALKTEPATKEKTKSIIKFLEENYSPDHWNEPLMGNFPDVYVFVNIYKKENNLDISLSETLYRIKHDIKETPLCKCGCGKKTSYRGYRKGYGKYSPDTTCQWKDEEQRRLKSKNISLGYSNSYIENNKGSSSYFNAEYRDMKDAHYLFNNSQYVKRLYSSLREFDDEVPFYGFIENTNYKQRLWYFENNLDEPKKCNNEECKNEIHYSINYCSSECRMMQERRKDFKKSIEDIAKKSNCEILTNEYKSHDILDIKCKCGRIFKKAAYVYKNGQGVCEYCWEYKNIKYSNPEIEILNEYPFLKQGLRILDGKEIDLFDEQRKIGIEYNGLIWHSNGTSKHSKFNSKNKKYYHIEKTQIAHSKNIKLFHIFENEWLDPIKKDIWRSILNKELSGSEVTSIQGDFCSINEVSNKDIRNFMEENSLDGCDDCDINLGLFYGQEILTALQFNFISGNETCEIKRIVSKNFIEVLDSVRLLLEFIGKEYNLKKFKVILNRRFCYSEPFKRLGFKIKEHSEPYGYLFETGKMHFLCEKEKIIEENKNILFKKGYREIFDCGNIILEK